MISERFERTCPGLVDTFRKEKVTVELAPKFGQPITRDFAGCGVAIDLTPTRETRPASDRLVTSDVQSRRRDPVKSLDENVADSSSAGDGA